MDTRQKRMRQKVDRGSRKEIEGTYRRSLRTPKNVGTKVFGGREPGKSIGCQASCLSSGTQRLLGTFGFAG